MNKNDYSKRIDPETRQKMEKSVLHHNMQQDRIYYCGQGSKKKKKNKAKILPLLPKV